MNYDGGCIAQTCGVGRHQGNPVGGVQHEVAVDERDHAVHPLAEAP